MNDFKLLFVDGNPISSSSNVGILKRNLFSSWRKESIAQIVTSGVSTSICVDNSYYLKRNGLFSHSWKDMSNDLDEPIHESMHLVYSSFFKNLRLIRSTILRCLYPSNTRSIRKHLKEFNPDFVFSFGYTIPELLWAYRWSKWTNAKLVLYITDDYINATYTRNIALKVLFNGFFIRLFLRLISKSSMVFVVSESLRVEYKKRYNLNSVVLMDCVDISAYLEKTEVFDIHERSCINMVFVGGFAPDRLSSLMILCDVIKKHFNINGVYKFRLKIFTFDGDIIRYKNLFGGYAFVEFKEFVKGNDLINVQREADVLLHVESFDSRIAAAMTRFSMSTKLFQYVAASKPIFAFGPSDIESISYISRNNLGVVCDSSDMINVVQSLSYLLKEYVFLLHESVKNREFAKKVFNPIERHSYMMECLKKISN